MSVSHGADGGSGGRGDSGSDKAAVCTCLSSLSLNPNKGNTLTVSLFTAHSVKGTFRAAHLLPVTLISICL